MVYSSLTFNFIVYLEKSTKQLLEWRIFSFKLKKICEEIKKQYKCEWKYGRGDGRISYVIFKDKTFTEKEFKQIEKKIKSIGQIINIILDSTTKYKHSNLLYKNPEKHLKGWYRLQFFVDSNFDLYKKIVGSYWYTTSYYNSIKDEIIHYTADYLNYIEDYNYLKSK